MKNTQVLLLVLLFIACLCLTQNSLGKIMDEEILVEKEGQETIPTPVRNTQQTPKTVEKKVESNEAPKENKPTNVVNEQVPTPRNKDDDYWNGNELRELMREMRNYQFGNDWFGNYHSPDLFNSFHPRSFFGNSLFSNNLFGDVDLFWNVDHSLNQMRRRMDNMFRRTSFLPSLFNQNQNWFENSIVNSLRRSELSSNEENRQPVQPLNKASPEEPKNEKPIVEKRRRPISSLVKNEQIDGKTQISLDVNNIPRDVFDKKDIEIKIQENSSGDMITIRGEKKTENGHFEFSKSFKFPKGTIDFDQVKASLSDEGTLNVKIPTIDIPEKVKSISVE